MDQQHILEKLESLEQKVRTLSEEHRKLQEEHQKLKEENQDLNERLAGKKEEMKDFYNQAKISKIASAVGENTQDRNELKLVINEYIREIDKCIAYLNQ